MRRFRSAEPTAMYFASGPNFTAVIFPEKPNWTVNEDQWVLNLLKHSKTQCEKRERTSTVKKKKEKGKRKQTNKPVPDKSGKVLMVFHSNLTLATW